MMSSPWGYPTSASQEKLCLVGKPSIIALGVYTEGALGFTENITKLIPNKIGTEGKKFSNILFLKFEDSLFRRNRAFNF